MADTSPDGTVFEIQGPVNAPVVILIHGLGLNRACWQWTSPALTDRYRVLTYDLYGHGDSAPPPAPPSLGMFSCQLSRLMDHCEIPAGSITGFSLGGMIARRFAQDLPNRTKSLIILHSPHTRPPDAQAAILKRVDQARIDGPGATVEAALERWFTEHFRLSNPELMDEVQSWVLANKQEIYHTIYSVLAEGVEEITAPNPAIACPTLVITGDEDFGNGPEMALAIAAEIRSAETLILPGLRHMALAECPDAVNLPVRLFLDRVHQGNA